VNWVAIKMLTGDRSKYLGLVFGITLASFLMSQQISIFIGVTRRFVSQIEDTNVDVWVMSHKTEQFEITCPMPRGVLQQVRGVPGVEWAVPFQKGIAQVVVGTGRFRDVILLGVDDNSLMGAPEMVVGAAADLYQADAVIIDTAGHEYLWPGEDYQIGRTFILNGRRAVLAGVCKVSPPFLAQPVFYTRYSLARAYLAPAHHRTSFILVKAGWGCSPEELCRRIEERTGCRALTQRQFVWETVEFVLRNSGIAPIFGITVTLGFVVGAAISGQQFYLLTLENLKLFGSLMAMGLGSGTLVRMVLLQGALVAGLGYCMGLGGAAIFFDLGNRTTNLAGLRLYWQAAAATGVAVALIMGSVVIVALRRILALEPAVIFRS
jgi:putative ABC transport system permease protein